MLAIRAARTAASTVPGASCVHDRDDVPTRR
jgi:hypothetical protein